MLSSYRRVFIIILGLLLSVSVRAESEINTPSRSIDLRAVITKTFNANPELRAFRYLLNAQDSKELQASMAASPELSFAIEDALGTGAFDGIDNAQATLSIGWVLEGKTRQGYMDVARAETLSLIAEFNNKRLDVAAETARLYLASLAYQTRLINADKTLSLAKEAEIAVSKRVRAGKTPDAELARAQAEVARRELDYEDIEHELSSAIRKLAAQWGETEPGFSRVDGDITVLPVIASFESLKSLIEQSPEYVLMLSDKRAKQAELKLAEAQSSPDWKIDLGVRHYNTNENQALVAGFSIPFGERSRNTGRINQAKEILSGVTVKKEELRVRYETALYVLYQELEHSIHRIEAFRGEIIPRLEKALKETRRAYEAGRYSYFEWNLVQAELLDARSALVEDSIDAHMKVIEIERLTGVSMTLPTTK